MNHSCLTLESKICLIWIKKGGLMRKIVILLLICNLLFAGLVRAAEEGVEEDAIIVKASQVHYKEDSFKGEGGITLVKRDIIARAEEGEYFKNENRAVLVNEVEVEYDKGNVKADKMTALLKVEEYTFNNNVVLKHQLEDGEFDLKSPYLLMYFTDNSFEARKGVVIDYNGRTLKGDNVDYNDQEQLLELSGNVYIEEDNGDWVKGNQAVFYLETEEFTVDGGVELEIKITSN